MDEEVTQTEIIMRVGEVRYRLNQMDGIYSDIDLHRKHPYWSHEDEKVSEKLHHLRGVIQRLDDEISECYSRLNEL